MPYLATDDAGDIYGVGDTPEQARAEAERDQVARIDVYPCTERLAERVRSKGWNANAPAYGWRVQRDGIADLSVEDTN